MLWVRVTHLELERNQVPDFHDVNDTSYVIRREQNALFFGSWEVPRVSSLTARRKVVHLSWSVGIARIVLFKGEMLMVWKEGGLLSERT